MKDFTKSFFSGREEDFWVRFVLLGLFTAGVFFLIFYLLKSKIKNNE